MITRPRTGAIPLPATLSLILGKHIGAHASGAQTRLYSAYPFPWRREEGGLRDAFGQDAWHALQQHPDTPFYRFEEVEGRRALRDATADRMRTGCVNCHNTHPESPKTDWQTRDVRGVLEVILPLDAAVAQTRGGLRTSFALMAFMSMLGLSGLAMVISRLRRSSADLEQRAHALQLEISERHRAEDALQQAHDTLEQQVQERTSALERSNAQLTQEIAERQQLEAQIVQAQKMQAMGTLAGGIAHEFNNILTAILGFTELATYDVSPATPTYHHLQAVLTAGNRAKELVQQILTFSHQSNPERRAVSLAMLVQESLSLIRASLPTTIAIESHIAPDAGTVLADPTQLHQILMNLCVNADYAMRQTGGILEVAVARIEVDAAFAATDALLQPGSHVRLTVRDTGSGMSPKVMARIFEPFFTTKGIGEGTGMGLAIVHGIVTSYGGAMTVESRPGEGSTFAIYLPQLEAPAAVETSEVAEALPQGHGCILYVDDEELLVYLGREMLESLGYEVTATTSSVEALETFGAMPQRFDLVITDQTMPTLTGENLTKELRRIRADIPIILCTGFSHVIDAEKAKAMGLNAFCMKPLDIGELARTIERVLGHHEDVERTVTPSDL